MTVIVNVPVTEGVHDRVVVPEFVKLEEVRLQAMLVDGDDDSVSEIVPVKPFRNETVIVEVAADPVETDALVGLAVRLKSSSV